MKKQYRIFKQFSWKKAQYRIYSPAFDVIIEEIKKQRAVLESYIRKHEEFKSALEPLSLLPNPPPIVRQMADAADKTGVGPMAGVAGAIAQAGVMAACMSGINEAVVENGGDIFLLSEEAIVVGLYTGGGRLSHTLAFLVKPEEMPLAICSSSSHMGHSQSFGECNLATVTAKDGALADAAATLVCNSVKRMEDMTPVLEKVAAISGICGILIVKDDHIGIIGTLPEIVKNKDPDIMNKITHDPSWKL